MAEILMIIPYGKLFPPKNGGALRCFYLLKEIAKYHTVHCVLFQPPSELSQSTDGFVFPDSVVVYSVAEFPPPTTFFSYLPKRIGIFLQYRWLRRSWWGPASDILLRTHHLISFILGRHSIKVVIYEHLAAMMAAPYVNRIARGSIVGILDAHNVEHILARQVIEKQRRIEASLYWYESHLTQFVDGFFACSDDDRNLLERINGKSNFGFTIPNGIDTEINPFDNSLRKNNARDIIFCGSLDWLPNKEGLLWFYTDVWPLIQKVRPEISLVVVGRGADDKFTEIFRQDSSVNFVGAVPDVKPYYKQAGIAVVPLHSGSGTRLKILEAMSLGNPVVSTRLGAQGIDAIDGEHLSLADEPGEFAQAILNLLTDQLRFEQIRYAARNFVVQNYDWQVIGQRMNSMINSLLTT
jgi:polysaccharide biosynthesis protein PslH